MKIEEIKQGQKVKIPTSKNRGFGYDYFRSVFDVECTKAEFGTVNVIYGEHEIELIFPRDVGGNIHYSFTPADLELFEETPTTFVAGSEVEAHTSIPEAVLEETELAPDEPFDWSNPPAGVTVMSMGKLLDKVEAGENPLNTDSLSAKKGLDRIVNPINVEVEIPKAGLRYNEGKLDYTLMDMQAFKPMIEVLAYGAHKYSLFMDKDGKTYKGSEVRPDQIQDFGLELMSSGRDNWKLGGPNMTLLKLTSSLFRHLAAMLGGEDKDQESGLSHIGHIMCNVMFIGYHWQNHTKNKKAKKGSQFDDRFKN